MSQLHLRHWYAVALYSGQTQYRQNLSTHIIDSKKHFLCSKALKSLFIIKPFFLIEIQQNQIKYIAHIADLDLFHMFSVFNPYTSPLFQRYYDLHFFT